MGLGGAKAVYDIYGLCHHGSHRYGLTGLLISGQLSALIELCKVYDYLFAFCVSYLVGGI